jgi:hypothetical protein
MMTGIKEGGFNSRVEGEKHFKQFRKAFPSEQQAKLLFQKNEYCYEYRQFRQI